MYTGSLIMDIVQDGIFAAIAAIGFSSISNTPRRAYLCCGAIAALGHSVRYMLMSPQLFSMNIIIAGAIAAIMVGLASVLLSPSVKCPAEVCLFPSLLPMIPGMHAYRSVEALLSCLSSSSESVFIHNFYLLSYNGLTAIAIIVSMVVGANIPIFLLKRLSFQATR